MYVQNARGRVGSLCQVKVSGLHVFDVVGFG